MCLAWPGASHTNRGNGRLVGCVFCGAPVLGIALGLQPPTPPACSRGVRRDPSPVKWYRGVYRATGIPRAVSTVSASHSLWCAPAARPQGGRALEAGSRRNHPAASRRVLMLVRTPRGVRFLVFRPEKPSAIVRALRCAQVLLTCGEPDSSRKLCPTRSGLAACAYFVGKLVLLSPVPGRCTARRALIGTSCLLGRKTRR